MTGSTRVARSAGIRQAHRGHGGQRGDGGGEHGGIGGAHAEELAHEESGERQRPGEAEPDPQRGHAESAAEHQVAHAGGTAPRARAGSRARGSAG